MVTGTALVASSDSNGPLAAVIFAVIAWGGGLFGALKSWRKYWAVVDTPTSACAAVFVGRNEVIGRAQPHVTLTSPVTGQSCVWFRWQLQRWKRGSRNRGGRWVNVEKRSSTAPFWLVDDTGGVLVRPRGASIDPPRTFQQRAHSSGLRWSRNDLRMATYQGQDAVEHERARAEGWPSSTGTGGWLGNNDAVPIASLGRNYRIREWRLDPGSSLYVLGPAGMRRDVVALEFDEGHGPGELFISTRSETQVARGALWATIGSLLLALAGAVGFPAAVHAMQTDGTFGPEPGSPSTLEAVGGWMLLAGVSMALVIVALYWIRLYNRLVAVKQQAANSWSLIDVALRRRHDLLPNLVEVTKEYARHEQEVLEAVAGLRLGEVLPGSEELPTDATVDGATELNHIEWRSAHSLMALGEAYPDLKANTAFQDLTRRITEAENQVAYARQYYNDAVTVLRDRRQTFPGNLVARYVTTPSWHLFAADAEDRYVPPADLAPAPAPEDAPEPEAAADPDGTPAAAPPPPAAPQP